MNKSTSYTSAANNVESLDTVMPKQLAEFTTNALHKLSEALDGDVSGYVANRLRMNMNELRDALAAEQVEGVALAMYNIEKKAQSVIIGDQTGIGKGRQAAAMIRYGLLSGYFPIFFTDRYTLFSDMYRDCKALGIKDARPLVVNSGVSVVDFDNIVEEESTDEPDEIWTPYEDEEDGDKDDEALMKLYQKQYEVVYKAPNKQTLQDIFDSCDIPTDTFDYMMITYSQLKDAKKDSTRLEFLQSVCEKHRVLFIFDEAHRSSSVSAGKVSVITQCINKILTETEQTQCVFLSATFAKRPESLITFMRRTELSALATENTLEKALHNGGVPMQEYVSSSLASVGQMIRREHSSKGIPSPIYTYLDDDLAVHGELFDKVMFFFREIVELSYRVKMLVNTAKLKGQLASFSCYPTRSQLFYINKILLLSLKAQKVAEVAVKEVKQGKSVVIGMSDTLECILHDAEVNEDGSVRGDISALLIRLMEKTVHSTKDSDYKNIPPVFELIEDDGNPENAPLLSMAEEIGDFYRCIMNNIKEEVFHLPMSPIDVIKQLIIKEEFTTPDGRLINIRFEECTGRAHQLEYLSPEGSDDYVNATITSRKKRHSNHIFNDFQNNKLDVILINACGAIGASAHAISTAEVPDDQVRQRKMLIVQNDLDVNIDLQKRGRINRTGQRMDLPPLYEYIITAIPSEKRLNMMLRAKLRSLSANTAAWQDQDREQADFIDISNKYGNLVATDYINDNEELASVLGLNGNVTASKLLARIAMLSVTAQQDIVDDIMSAYTTLEAELRRINQWDLEREFRDYEAEYVKEELFTTAKADTKFGGCSYLTTYKCKQKTYPYDFKTLMELCRKARDRYGEQYSDNPALKKQVKEYYAARNKQVRNRFTERRTLLHDGAKQILTKYCQDEELPEIWLQKACSPYAEWNESYFEDVNAQDKANQIMRKLISYSNEYNHLLDREKIELKKYSEEKKRLVTILSKANIGSGYECYDDDVEDSFQHIRTIYVLKEIKFGKDERNKFTPGRVELVFAMSAFYTEVHINLVHNDKCSNYDRINRILDHSELKTDENDWNNEIAANNNKIVERKIITGNILGAYVHPAIAELKPRFITFSLKNHGKEKPMIQNGLLLPKNEYKIRETIKNVSIPLNEGIKYVTNINTSYVITGLGVDFSILPYRDSDTRIRYVICVNDKHSKMFETDERFDEIRPCFSGSIVTSIYDKDKKDKKKRKPLMHYQTEKIDFSSETFQNIIQTLAQMDAVLIVPRDQLSYGDAQDFMSRAEHDDNEAWERLDWKNVDEIPMPPVKEKLLMRISAPVVPKSHKGKAVLRHSEYYIIAKEIMSLEGFPLNHRNTRESLRHCYMRWYEFYNSCIASIEKLNKCILSLSYMGDVCRDLQRIIENREQKEVVTFSRDVKESLDRILESEYMEANDLFKSRFENEMMFLSPEKDAAQAFLDEMPYSPSLDSFRKCIIDYLEGKTDIINSPIRI